MILTDVTKGLAPLLLTGSMAMPVSAQEKSPEPVIEFAGLDWRVKQSVQPVGPGGNFFSADSRDVWVDDQGSLHLKLNHRDDRWHCSELISDWPVGYGTYEFHLAGGAEQLDPNVVLGLFTWDTDSWQTDANSEIDIELTRWCEDGAPNLHYSVHPAWGPDGKHPERTTAELIDLKGEASTHVITWSPDGVECASYYGGAGPDPNRLLLKWRFGPENPPRMAGNSDGRVTDPITIPKPHATTSVRINLWLVDGDRDKMGDPPTDGGPAEVIVTDFRYTPLTEGDAGVPAP